eukprot:gene7162-9765_t
MKGSILNPAIIIRLKENTAGPQGLHHFDISNSNYGPREISIISDAIKINYQSSDNIAPLISIDFSGNSLCGVDSMMSGVYDSDGLSDFCATLISIKNSRLRKINLSRNYLDIRGFMIIAGLLSFGPSSLIDLNLRNCAGSGKAIEKLLDALKPNKSLLTLDISQNDLGLEGAELIGDALANNKKLKQLSISDCNIPADGANSIFKGLINNNNLEILNISDNWIGDSGAESIGVMLRSNGILKHLDIQENHITSDGLSSIAKGLAKNKSLVFLGLQWNDINNEGAAKLGEALMINSTLKSVCILGNHIDADGLGYIIQGSMAINIHKPIDIDLGFAFMNPSTAKVTNKYAGNQTEPVTGGNEG